MFHQLSPQDFPKVKPLFADLNFNLIITAVIEQTSPGKIYVDNLDNPTASFLDSAEGCYLAGSAHNAAFNAGLKDLLFSTFLAEDEYIVLECDSPEWASTLDAIFQGRVMQYPRYYYTFDQMKLDWQNAVPDDFSLEQVTVTFLERAHLKHMDDVLNGIHSNWNSQTAFLNNGFGFCLVNDSTVVSWCLADCASGERCEIGIHTDPHYQKRGFGALTVSATVDHALKRGFTEIGWHCWEHNLASCKVAEKVGFQFQHPYTAYLCLANEERHLIECGLMAARQGNHREAVEWYTKAGAAQWAYFLAARSYAPLGEYPQAFQALEQAVKLGWNYPDYLLADEFKPLRELAEWQALITKLGA